jgi:hypothetical protein
MVISFSGFVSSSSFRAAGTERVLSGPKLEARRFHQRLIISCATRSKTG